MVKALSRQSLCSRKLNLPNDPNHWRMVRKKILDAIDQNWDEEPDEIRLIRLGVIKTKAGTMQSSFPLLVHHKAYLMIDGGGIMGRYLKLSRQPEITLEALKLFTAAVFFDTFNHFDFFGDIVLETFAKLGP